MSEKELSRYYWLKKEIKDLEDRLIEFGAGVSSPSLENEIISNGNHISIQERRAELVEKLINARLSALEEYLRIESYIEKIEDSEMRQIMRYRFLDLFSWSRIGEEMNYERTTISKKLRNFIKNN